MAGLRDVPAAAPEVPLILPGVCSPRGTAGTQCPTDPGRASQAVPGQRTYGQETAQNGGAAFV